YLNGSRLQLRSTDKTGVSSIRIQRRSIGAQRLHQRKQLVDGLLCRQPQLRAKLRNVPRAYCGSRNARLLGRDAAGRLSQALDPLLDVAERLKAGLDGVV